MNAALVILAAAIVVPIAVIECRRKWADWRFVRRVRGHDQVCGCRSNHENGAIR